MSLFGSTTAKPSIGLFGSTQPSQPAGGSLFGAPNTNQQQNASAGFGSLGQPQPQQQSGSGGTLFGGTGGSVFGNAGSSNNQSIFGNTNSGGNTGTTGSGLLGGTNPNTGTTGGGIFGSTNNTGTGTSSIFGQPAPNSGPSTFGQSLQQQPQQGVSAFGSLGQNQTQNQSQPQNQSQGVGLFGLNQHQSSNTSSGLFGPAAPSTSQPSSAFSLSQPAPANSLFGPKPSLTSTSFLSGSQLQQAPDNSAQAQSTALQQRIEAIVAAWNPQSPQCRFQHYFYNLVDPRQTSMYGRPTNATNEALWQQAVRENPDPSCMVPVLAVGFDDLQKRVDAQGKQAAFHQEKLKELQTRLSTLSQTHLLSNTLRTTRALQTQTLITHRLLRLVEHIHLLIPSLRSSAIGPEEEVLRAKLERLKDEVQRSLGGGGGRGRINELWALLGAVKASKERDANGGREGVEWKVVDQEGLERLAAVLAEQQQGLAHLINIINNDLKDLQVIENGGDGVAPEVNHHTLPRGWKFGVPAGL